MMYGYGTGTDMTWWMVLAAILWFVLIVAAITALLMWMRRGVATAGNSGAQGILESRFARGEIDDEEYHRRLRTLG